MTVSVSDIGRYRLIVELARGGMGVVYLAVVRGPAGFSKLVVLKELKRELAEDPVFLRMFLDEARISARLSHPNVVQTNEVGSITDAAGIERHFIVMEFLEGQPLHRVVARLTKSKQLDATLYVRLLVDVLAGLHHAHELCDFDARPLDVVHRDVSPHNVLVTYDGQVKVVDFGIAKAVDQVSETKTGALKGKVAYMAPEQAAGQRVDRRADVFSVGAMLWEAAAGERLWAGMSEVAVLAALTSTGVPSPRQVRADVDPELERIVLKACAFSHDPSTNKIDCGPRYRTAAAMQADLERWLARQAEVPTPRSIGALVAETFANERRELRGIIEAQLGSVGEANTGELHAVPLARISSAGATPSIRSHSGDVTMPTPISHVGRTPTLTGTSTIDAGRSSRLALTATRSRKTWAFVIGAVALVAGIVVAELAMSKPAPQEPVRSIVGAPPDPPTAKSSSEATEPTETFRGLPRGLPEATKSSSTATVSVVISTSAPIGVAGPAAISPATPPRTLTKEPTPTASTSATIAPSADAPPLPVGRPKRKIDPEDPYKLP